MSIMDELKRLARPYSEDEDEYEEEYEEEELEEEEEEEEEEPVRQRPSLLRREAPAARPAPAPQPAARPAAQQAPAVNTTTISGISGMPAGGLQMVLVKPERYEEVSQVAKQLRSRNAVVLNLEATNADTARRLVDFLSGCAFALNGNIKKVATSTYVIAPQGIDIVGELTAEQIANTVISYNEE